MDPTAAVPEIDPPGLASAFVVLGAGASADGGVPMAREFVDFVRRHVAEMRPRSSAEELVLAFDAVKGWLTARDRPFTLEPFYEAMDDALEAHSDRVKGLVTVVGEVMTASRALERLHYETKRVIQTECAVGQADRARHLVPLFAEIAGLRSFPIVSFNYDSLVELAALTAGAKIAELVIGDDVESADIELIKVHGSVTWQTTPDGGIRRNLDPMRSVVTTSGELRSPVLESAMIYPSRRKMPLHAPFMRNSLRMQELLGGTGPGPVRSICIAIGYSFPDAHVRAWLFEAMSRRPDLRLVLVDPYPGRAIENIVRGMPTIRWVGRLSIAKLTCADALARGLDRVVADATPFGPTYGEPDRGGRAADITLRHPASGLASAADGDTLYITGGGQDGHVDRIDLTAAGPPQVVRHASGLRDPTGAAVDRDGSLLVVQTVLLRRGDKPRRGMGSLARIDQLGTRRILHRVRPSEVIRFIRDVTGEGGSAAPTAIFSPTLRWPTDVCVTSDGVVVVSEARSLLTYEPGRPLARRLEGHLLFNLVGLAAGDDGGVAGVEGGVGGPGGWSRVRRFDMSGGEVTTTFSAAVDGYPHLHGICYVPPLGAIVVSQGLSWPYGRIILLDYPSLDRPRQIGGFDFPARLSFIPGRDLIAVSASDGIHLIGCAELSGADPIPPIT